MSTIKKFDKSRPVGLVLMTALPPTYGHKALIEFAHSFMRSMNGDLHVIMNSRSFEPLDGETRFKALTQEFDADASNSYIAFYENGNIIFDHCADDDIPQNPSEHPNFWNIWCKSIYDQVDSDINYVFASETYGIKLAEVLNASFIPFDIDRSILDAKGTKVRKNVLNEFDKMLPGIQKLYRKKITIFGPESVGKTTMSKFIFPDWTVTRVPEWARTYLEQVGPEITDEKMLNIVYGQYASQKVAEGILGKPLIIQDTDLLSTLGYYKLWKGSWPFEAEYLFKETKSDLYILMNDQIPFTPDPLRYGGDKRESDNKFWKDLLIEFKCNFYEVKSIPKSKQSIEIEDVIFKCFLDTFKLHNFERT